VTTGEGDYYRLRTEWLRFKSHLQDGLTGLPALPAVAEEARRLLETHGGLEVAYLDLGRSGWHETKLGWAAYDETIRDFAKKLAAMRESGALRPEDLVCLHTVRSDRFLILSGRGPEETGPGLKDRVVQALRKGAKAQAQDAPRIATGSARVRKDPMTRPERQVHQAVAAAMLTSLLEREGIESARREELLRLIAEAGVRSVFHPIVKIADRSIVGHEALSRPIGMTGFDSVEELFAFAESTDLLTDFERLCRATSIRAARAVPNRGLLFLNASARAALDLDWANGAVDSLLQDSGISPRDVVVEITERLAVVRHDAFAATLRTFKERGFRVAIDDMGAGYASLQALASIEPEFLKFDVSLVRNIDKSSIKRSLLESLRSLGDKIRARVIAEGIEREEERTTLISLGVELGQGFLFHKEDVVVA
jgi:EAL domain-containing protein (putative c-di-GMP-specific phosphodiesterase class I)